MTDTPDKPVHTIRDGSLGVSIWKRQGRRGPYFEVTVSRSFFDRESESYGYTACLREWNLEPLGELFRQAREWIRQQTNQTPDATSPPATETEDAHGRR